MKRAPTRSPRLPLFAIVPAIAGLTVLLAAACGDDGESSPTDRPSAAASGPGTITVTSSAIEGQDGRVLLIFAAPEAGGAQMARACIPITSDSFAASGTVLTDTPPGDDPCGGATPETSFPEGTYTLTAGIYAPPAQSPEAETTQTVQVSGDVAVEIDGASLSR